MRSFSPTVLLCALSVACTAATEDTAGADTAADTDDHSAGHFTGDYVGSLDIQIEMADGPEEICTGAVALGVDGSDELVGAGACAFTFGYADAKMRLSFGGTVHEDGQLDVMIKQSIESVEIGEDEWLLPTGDEYVLDGEITSGLMSGNWVGTLYTPFGAFDFTGGISAN